MMTTETMVWCGYYYFIFRPWFLFPTRYTQHIYIFHLVTLINHLAYLYRIQCGHSGMVKRKVLGKFPLFFFFFFFLIYFSNDICIQCLLMLQLIFRRLIFFFSFIFLLNEWYGMGWVYYTQHIYLACCSVDGLPYNTQK